MSELTHSSIQILENVTFVIQSYVENNLEEEKKINLKEL